MMKDEYAERLAAEARGKYLCPTCIWASHDWCDKRPEITEAVTNEEGCKHYATERPPSPTVTVPREWVEAVQALVNRSYFVHYKSGKRIHCKVCKHKAGSHHKNCPVAAVEAGLKEM